MAQRVLIIGADAAGMSAAHQGLRTAKARGRDLEVVALEMSGHTSFSACGIPYWIANDVAQMSDLVARTASDHRAAGIDLRMRHEAMSLDLQRQRCEVRDHQAGQTYTIGFDHVMMATGAAPIMPDWARDAGPQVRAVTTLDDGAAWHDLLSARPGSAIVVGGGYIGVEVAESLARRGIATTLLSRGDNLMRAALEPGTASEAARGLRAAGVNVVTGAAISELQSLPSGSHLLIAQDGRQWSADVVAVALGVRPRTRIAVEAGIPVGGSPVHGALVPDATGRVMDGVWAAGDCAAVHHRVLDRAEFMPLGTHANKAGRVVGTNLGGGDASFAGVVGTAITRAGSVQLARTGILATQAADLTAVEWVERALTSTTSAGYMPEASPIRVWVGAERSTGRLLGCQIAGGNGSGKRIDTAATAIWNRMSLAEVAELDLAYAPPFSPVWDPVQIACRSLADRL